MKPGTGKRTEDYRRGDVSALDSNCYLLTDIATDIGLFAVIAQHPSLAAGVEDDSNLCWNE